VPSAPLVRNEAVAWSEAEQANSIEGYERYQRDFPTGQHPKKARERLSELLRKQLMGDLTNANLRQRYLDVRTDKQRRGDGFNDSAAKNVHGFVVVIGGLLSAGLTLFLDGDVYALKVVIGLIFGGFLGMLVGWPLSSVFGWWLFDPIAAELGPLTPDTPRDLEAARRYLLGDDKPT
jgi:hypothetical protein